MRNRSTLDRYWMRFVTVMLQVVMGLSLCGHAFAATWGVVGTANFSAGAADYTFMAVASDNTPYVAYQDSGNGGRATVMKYNGSSWAAVGNAGFSANGASYTNLAFAPDGTLYIAFQDTSTNYPTVMKWNGASWSTVGSITVPCIYPSIAFASDGTPYLAFADITNPTYYVKAYKYSGGSWSQVGGTVSTGGAYQVKMAVAPNGTPFVAYQDLATANAGTTVMKYSGSAWALVGSANFSAGQATYLSMAFAPGDNNPYVAYVGDAAQSNKASVRKFDGTSAWNLVGAQSFTPANVAYVSLATTSSGTPYLAFSDGANGSKASVMVYTGGAWTQAGNADFSADEADYVSLAIDSGGSLYVAYQAYPYPPAKATVMKLAAASAPTVTGISPASGPAAGGTSVVITGTNLTGASAVKFGGTNATGYTVNSATQITATAPAGSGTVDVTVTTSSGTSVTGSADQFTYVAAPTVSGISPGSGPLAGGTGVTITGTGFLNGATVTIGGTAATGVIWNSATSISATTPSGSAGAKNVVVTNPDTQSGTLTSGFTYMAAPAVTGISPTGGPLSGGTSVTVSGTNFTGATSVTIGGVAVTGITVVNATTITATTPSGTAGARDVVVTTPGGSGTGTGLFTYFDIPAITGVSPASGTTTGGTSVIITGANLTGATAVKFGSTNAASFTVNSPTQITAVSPAGSAGIVDITVTNVGATSTTKAADGFTYLVMAAPTVTGISPSIGPVPGGTPVTITGTNFAGATAVMFGSTNAAFTANSATRITAVSPGGVSGEVDITVITPGGTSATGAADQFTYVAPTATVIIDPNDAAKIYAGLDGAGVFISANSGANWTPATTQPTSLRVKALVIKPGDSTKLFAASYGGGVFASADSGDHWIVCANTNMTNQNLVSLTIDATGKLYAGTEAGVFVSNDNCASWNAMNTGLPL